MVGYFDFHSEKFCKLPSGLRIVPTSVELSTNPLSMKHFFSFALSVLLLGSCLFAQDLSWTPEFSMQFKSIQSTTLSADGQYVAYVVREPVMEADKSEYRSQIWVAKTDGSMNVQYTRHEKSSTSPAFSPDGQYLAFLSKRDEKKTQLWRMRLMGGEPEMLTDEESSVSRFQWSPDGSHIAFSMSNPETKEEKKAKKEKSHVILVDQQHKYSHLYSLSLTQTDSGTYPVQRLTEGEFTIRSFDWAPDGSKLVFDHANDPNINTGFLDLDISWVSADSGAVQSLVKRPGVDSNPRFSHDGSMIAFGSSGGQPEPIGLTDLFVIPTTGGTPTALALTHDRRASVVGWSEDDQMVYYSENVKTQNGISMVKANGKGKPKAIEMARGVRSGISMQTKVNRMTFVYQNLDQAPEVYTANLDGTETKMLSEVNTEIELPEMGKTELISWKSKDGMEIEGLLTYPIGYETGTQYPIILQVHGGPGGVFSERFTGAPSIYLTQYFAEQGFLILRPNPRGSTGYGKDFRYANFMDWGYGDYEDLMSGVDHVIGQGMADANQQYLMGWSYGGYMTSFAVTRTSRFKAASMGAGLPNLISMVTTTDIPDYLAAHMGGEFWDDYETYEKHSAMYRIKEVTTPTQVIHGANDLRVPTDQGYEFYVALKRLGVPTEMIVLPRTPHGPREPRLQMEVSPRIMKWFEQHKGTDEAKGGK